MGREPASALVSHEQEEELGTRQLIAMWIIQYQYMLEHPQAIFTATTCVFVLLQLHQCTGAVLVRGGTRQTGSPLTGALLGT